MDLVFFKIKVLKIAELLNRIFNYDVLLYFQIHEQKGFDFNETDQFVKISKLPSALVEMKNKNYKEFRFFCKSNKVMNTIKKEKYFSNLKMNKKNPQFFLIPYYNISSGSSNNKEKFYTCAYDYEFNLKVYKNDYTINCKNKSKFSEKILQEIKFILNEKSYLNIEDKYTTNFSSKKILNNVVKIRLKKSILKIKRHMSKGDCYLANLTYTHIFQKEKFIDYRQFINSWFSKLSRFGIYFYSKNKGIASFSPERFLLNKKNHIICEPIKGTSPFNVNQSTKSQYANCLWENTKEMNEHILVVDLIRNDLNSFCLPGSVHVYKPFRINIAGNLLQMQSAIIGKIKNTVSAGECFAAMLPAGSITGSPKKIVSDLISRYEINDRGYYTGICGILEPNGDFDSCVLIRSLFKGVYGTYLGVGAGITSLSNSEKEVEEFKVKLESFLY